MNVLVPVKRVVDPYLKTRISETGVSLETASLKHVMNPFDEIALEEALRWLEQGYVHAVEIISIGTSASLETLRYGLALGATQAYLIETAQSYTSLNIAKILSYWVKKNDYGCVIMGKQAIDDDANQTPQMLAGLLNWPQATYASSIIWKDDHCEVSREVDEGIQTVLIKRPCVLSVDLRLNQPRYATLPNIMKAKQKPLSVISCDTLPLNLKDHQTRVKLSTPVLQKKVEILTSVDALMERLKKRMQF